MKKPLIKVEVVSDVVCPWCYIGKRRLEKAVEQLKDQYDFNISYSPFELNPSMPKTGANQKEYLASKFGSSQKFDQITAHVTRTAAGEGLKFDFLKQEVSPNTLDAHRIIRLAKAEGKQEAVKEAFMKAYFEDGIDLSKNENLTDVAEKAGLEKEKVKKLLESSEGVAEVKDLEQLNIMRGVSGVPFYIINDKYGFSGAQPSEVFVNAFKEIAQQSLVQGESCDVETGEC